MEHENILFAGLLGKVKTLIHKLITIEQWICVFFSAFFIVLMMAQVILRYVFNSPVYGVDELVIALFIWYSALGVVVVYWEKGHAMIGFLSDYMGNRVQKGILILSELIVLVTAIIFASSGYDLFLIQKKTQPVGGLPLNRSFYFALPMIVMGISFLIASVFRLFEIIKTSDVRKLIEERVSLD